MHARAMMTMNGPARPEQGQRLRWWLATACDWSMLMRRPGSRATDAPNAADNLRRRRRDRHPDAPPRRPLLASRDLPPAETVHGLAGTMAVITPIAPPRSPEPMSDAQIAQLIAAATARPVAIPAAAQTAPAMPDTGSCRNVAIASPAAAEAFPPATPALGPDMDAAAVEAALARALATLRKLAASAPATRRR